MYQSIGPDEAAKTFTLRRRDFSIFVAQAEVFTGEVLSQLLKEQGYNVVGRAANLADAIQQIRLKQPKCVIMDAELSGQQTFGVVRQSRSEGSTTRFILYTNRPDLPMLGYAMQTGFQGFLYASDGLDELYRCFHTVSSGGCYYSTGFLSLMKNYGVEVLDEHMQRLLERLSKREREILKLVGQGCPSDEMADALHISYRTLVNHKANIARKMEMNGVRHLTKLGISLRNYL